MLVISVCGKLAIKRLTHMRYEKELILGNPMQCSVLAADTVEVKRLVSPTPAAGKGPNEIGHIGFKIGFQKCHLPANHSEARERHFVRMKEPSRKLTKVHISVIPCVPSTIASVEGAVRAQFRGRKITFIHNIEEGRVGVSFAQSFSLRNGEPWIALRQSDCSYDKNYYCPNPFRKVKP